MPRIVLRVSTEGRNRIKMQEGKLLNAGLDTQDPPHWFIGYGHDESNPRPVRGLLNGEFYTGPVMEGVSITPSEADRLFDADLAESEEAITDGVHVDLLQCQLDALADFCHHYGTSRFLGSTLLQKINHNPNNLEAILPQFARWTINAGKHDKAMYMRSARRACIYAGAPIPQVLWEPKRFPWKLTDTGAIDYSVTPTVFALIDLGKQKAQKPSFPPPPPELQPAPAPTITTITIITDKPKEAPPLPPKQEGAAVPSDTVETPAVEISPPVVAKAEPSIQQPPSPDGSADPIETTAGQVLRETPAEGAAGKSPSIDLKPSAAPTLPPVLAPPKPPPVILPKTVDVRSIPYGEISPENGVKNMTDSRRFTGMLIVGAGSLIQVLAAREVVSSAAGAIFFDLSRDPVVVAIIAGGVVFIIGQITKGFGTKRITKGMTGATELLK